MHGLASSEYNVNSTPAPTSPSNYVPAMKLGGSKSRQQSRQQSRKVGGKSRKVYSKSRKQGRKQDRK